MRRAVAAVALVAALLLGCEGEQKAAPEDAGAAATATAALGGPPAPQASTVASVRATSRVLYVLAPDRPHVLLATFAPERARVELRLAEEDAGQRRIETRLGERVGHFAAGGGEWQALEGEARAQALRRLELRRALLCFPDGFEWSDAAARADGRAGVAHRAPVALGLGEILAELDGEGQLERFAVLAPGGREQEVLRVRTVMPIGGRSWPRDLELEVDGIRVWSETVLAVQPNVHFRDDFFAPEDDGRAGGALPAEATLVTLPAVAERRVPLAEGERDWTAALARAAALAGEHAGEVESGLVFELGDDGRAVAVVLRARASGAAGFEPRPAGRGASLVVDDFAAIGRSDLGQLEATAAGAPGWRRAGAPYARELSVPGGGRRVQVVLPLEPAGD